MAVRVEEDLFAEKCQVTSLPPGHMLMRVPQPEAAPLSGSLSFRGWINCASYSPVSQRPPPSPPSYKSRENGATLRMRGSGRREERREVGRKKVHYSIFQADRGRERGGQGDNHDAIRPFLLLSLYVSSSPPLSLKPPTEPRGKETGSGFIVV